MNERQIVLVVVAFAIILGIWALSSTVDASTFVVGSSTNYSEIIRPEFSYVMQGDNISQGLYYDLSGVYGWSGILGNWKNDYNAGYTVPDYIVNIADEDMHKVLIDSTRWNPGRWYQIDKYKANEFGNAFKSGNNYVFYVVKNTTARGLPTGATTTAPPIAELRVYNTSVYVYDGNTSIEIPMTVSVMETSHVDISIPIEQPKNVQTIIVPTTIVTQPNPVVSPKVVTPKTPLPIWISLLSLGVLLFRRS